MYILSLSLSIYIYMYTHILLVFLGLEALGREPDDRPDLLLGGHVY